MDKLAGFSRRHPLTVAMIAAALVLLGIVSMFRMPVSLFPGTSYPALTVETEYFGVTPDKIEEILTKPLEETLTQVGGIVRLYSTSEEGKSRINIEFERSADLDIKSVETRERVDLVAASFPREAQKPAILRYDPDRKPVLIVALDGKGRSLDELREIAEYEMKKSLERVPGAGEIIVAGGRVREVLVEMDRQILDAKRVSPGDVTAALQDQNVSVAVGYIPDRGGLFPVYVRGRFDALKSISGVAVAADESGREILISDLGRVLFSYREKDSAARTNGEENVALYVQRSGDADLMKLRKGVLSALDTYRGRNIEYKVLYDQSEAIGRMLRNLSIATLIGLLAVFLFVRHFWGQAQAYIITAVPVVAAVMACFPMYLLGLGFDLITLTGLILGMGCSLLFARTTAIALHQSGEEGIGKNTGELIAGLLLISAVFLPVLFAGEELKRTYGGLAITLLLTAGLSILILVVLSDFILAADYIRDDSLFRFVQPVLRLIYRFVFDEHSRFSHLTVVRYRGVFSLLLFVAIGILVYWFRPKAYLGSLEGEEIHGTVEFESGTSFARTDEITKKIEAILAQTEGVGEVSSRVQPGQGQLTLKLKDGIHPTTEFIEFLKGRVADVAEAFVYFQSTDGSTDATEISVDVYGEEIKVMDEMVRELARQAGTIPGVLDVVLRYKSPRPEIRIEIDRQKAESAGMNPGSIGQTVRYAIQGGVATKFIERRREIDVRLRLYDQFRDDPDDLRLIAVKSGFGEMIPLMEVASLEKGNSPVKIFRKNKKRVLSFTLKYAGSDPLPLKERLDLMTANFPLPEGYRIAYGDDLEDFLESQRQLLYVFSLAGAFVIMMLAALTESLRLPILLVMGAIAPISGAIILLAILMIPISLPVFNGLVLMVALSLFIGLRVSSLLPKGKSAFWADSDLLPVLQSVIALVLPAALFVTPLALLRGEGSEILRGVASLSLVVFSISALFMGPLFMRLGSEVRFLADILSSDGRKAMHSQENLDGKSIKEEGHVVTDNGLSKKRKTRRAEKTKQNSAGTTASGNDATGRNNSSTGKSQRRKKTG